MDNVDLNSIRQSLGNRISDLREKQGFGLREFSRKAELEHSQLKNIEKGRVDLKLATLVKISKAFNIQLKDLFDF
jgi:transcriptional regulator with XRE-family HTH domain